MLYRFAEFELDTQRCELRRAGVPQPLEPQGLNVLRYLIKHGDRVVSKDELLEHLWPNQHVTEATLTQRLMAVRRALGESGRAQRYIRGRSASRYPDRRTPDAAFCLDDGVCLPLP